LLFLQVVGVQVTVQCQHRLAPAPPHCPLLRPEQLRHVLLLPAVVKDQADHLALLRRQPLDLLVEGAPLLEVAEVRRGALVRRVVVGDVGRGALAAAGGEVAGQVEQFAAARLKNSAVDAGGGICCSVRSRRIRLFCKTSSVSAKRLTLG
jgi:hypothetical protein